MKLMVTLLVRRLRIEHIVSAKARCTCVCSGESGNKGRVAKVLSESFPARPTTGGIYLKYHRCTL